MQQGPLQARAPCRPPAPFTAAPQEGAPAELLGNRVFQRLREHVKSMTDAHHSVPSGQAAPKEWVRGWSDAGKELPFADRIESR